MLAFCSVKAQSVSDAVSFEQFKNWLPKQIGKYVLSETSTEGEAEYNETVSYKANYLNSSESVYNLSLTDYEGFSSIKSQLSRDPNAGTEFKYHGRNAVLLKFETPQRSFVYAAIELSEIHASIVIVAAPAKEMDEIEGFLEHFDIKALNKGGEKKLQWPVIIPEQAHIKANILSGKYIDSSIEGYSKEFVLVVVKNDLLMKEVERISELYNSFPGTVKIENKILINCSSADTIEGLEALKDGERVTFTYYFND